MSVALFEKRIPFDFAQGRLRMNLPLICFRFLRGEMAVHGFDESESFGQVKELAESILQLSVIREPSLEEARERGKGELQDRVIIRVNG